MSDLFFFPGDDAIGSINVASHPDYTVAFISPSVNLLLGETFPLKWTLVRNDGSLVDPPTSAAVTIYWADGTQEGPFIPDIDAADTEPVLTFAYDYPTSKTGKFVALLLVTTAEGQVRGISSILYVSDAALVLGGYPTTYDLTTLVGQVRLLIADTDITNAVFSDAEISTALSMVGGTNPYLAGALLLEMRANDASNTGIAMRLGLDTIDRTKIPTLLREAAADLRRRTIGPILVNAPDQVFSTSSNGGNTPGTTDLW